MLTCKADSQNAPTNPDGSFLVYVLTKLSLARLLARSQGRVASSFRMWKMHLMGGIGFFAIVFLYPFYIWSGNSAPHHHTHRPVQPR